MYKISVKRPSDWWIEATNQEKIEPKDVQPKEKFLGHNDSE